METATRIVARTAVPIVATMLALIVPPDAVAAWPGRDGLLSVQPARGAGVLLMTTSGKVRRRVCPALVRSCPVVHDPVFSPDGRELALFGPSAELSIVYADGSCLACGLEYEGGDGHASNPAFDRGGSRLIFTDEPFGHQGLWTIGEDGIGARSFTSVVDAHPLPVGAGGRSPAVSVDGRIAFVRHTHGQDNVFVTNPARTRASAVALGGAPSWSPDGRSLAFAHAGRVEIVAAAGGGTRTLVRGSAPAWSPNGRWLAFLDPARYVSVIAARGGIARRLGHVRGHHVDWQPLVPGLPRCELPARSRVLMRTPEVTITDTRDHAGHVAYMACDRRRGILRLLDTSYELYGFRHVFGFASAGRYVAFQVATYVVGEGTSYDVVAYDLARGQLFDDAAGHTDPSGDGTLGLTSQIVNTGLRIDSLLVGASGAVTWLTQTRGYASRTSSTTSTTTSASGATITTVTTTTMDSNPTTSYTISAHDSHGRRVLDSAVQTGPAPPIAALHESGQTASWLHDGQPRSAQLAPASSRVIPSL
ncbi:MAG: hypothetical protein M3Y17_08750 [Actinomycetota bacterium]|nr:hypothetical protein [Actinomycetota bacterium]